MIEKTLLVHFKSGAGGSPGVAVVGVAALAGDIGGFQRFIQIAMDNLEGVGIGVVDADLLRRELMLDDLVFDALERQGARGVKPERLQITSQHLHRGDAAAFHRRHEIGAGRKRKVTGAPEPEPRRIGKVLNRRGAGRRDVEDARVIQGVLQAQACLTLH